MASPCNKAKGSAPIATNIILDREFAIGANEAFHVYHSFIPDERFMALNQPEEFPGIPEGIEIMFSLAGAISEQAHRCDSQCLRKTIGIEFIDALGFNELQ